MTNDTGYKPIYVSNFDSNLLGQMLLAIGVKLNALHPFYAISAVRTQAPKFPGSDEMVDKMIIMGLPHLEYQLGVWYLNTPVERAKFEYETGLVVNDMPIFPAKSFARQSKGKIDEAWECQFDYMCSAVFADQPVKGKAKSLLGLVNTGIPYIANAYINNIPADGREGRGVIHDSADVKAARYEAFVQEMHSKYPSVLATKSYTEIVIKALGYNPMNIELLAEAIHAFVGFIIQNKGKYDSKADLQAAAIEVAQGVMRGDT